MSLVGKLIYGTTYVELTSSSSVLWCPMHLSPLREAQREMQLEVKQQMLRSRVSNLCPTVRRAHAQA